MPEEAVDRVIIRWMGVCVNIIIIYYLAVLLVVACYIFVVVVVGEGESLKILDRERKCV